MIYFFYGENDFALRRAIDELVTGFSRQVTADAVTKIDAPEMDEKQIFGELLNLSLFTPRRLFVIKNITENKLFWEKLPENYQRIQDEFEVILLAAKPDKRTKTYKKLLKEATVREFLPLKHYEVVGWIQAEGAKMNMKILPDAAEELALSCSDDQWRIWREMEKLATLGRTVDKKCIQEFIEPDILANAFEILNLAISGDGVRAQNELKKLRRRGEDANKFLGLLASQIFALAGAVYGDEDSRKSAANSARFDVAKELKIHPFQLSKMRDLARSMGDKNEQRERVKKFSKTLAETDAKMKLARADEAWVLVEIALAKISATNGH